MIRASDFTWTIIDADDMELALDAADIYDFRFRWGGFQDRRRAPETSSASGSLILNRELSDSTLQRYRRLKVTAGSETYFDIIIADYEVQQQNGQTSLLLQSRGADAGNRELEWGLRPTPESPAVTVPQFTIPGATIITDVGAPLSEIGCISPPDPEGNFYSTTLRRIISGVESLGHVLLVEDVSMPSPTWIALPMPLNAESDHRAIGKEFSGFTDLIEINLYKRGLGRHWAADRYNATVGGRPFVERTITLMNQAIATPYTAERGTYLGQPYGGNRRAVTWRSSVSTRFAGFSRIQYQLVGPPGSDLRTYISPDGQLAGIVSVLGEAFINGTVRYYEWDSDYDQEERVYRANDKLASEKRTLGNRLFTVYNGDRNPERLQELIDAWDVWTPTYATMQFLVEDLAVGSPARHKPGDRVGLRVSDLSHHAVIIGAQWRMRGNRVLRVRWDLVTQTEIPDARLYLGDQDHPLYLESDEHPMYLEQ